MNTLKDYFERDQYSKHSGIELVSIAPGHAVARMPVRPLHLNALGTVQGGAIFTLADLAFAAASNSHGKVAVGINVSITYIKAVSSGTLFAEAHEIATNPKLGTYTITVTDDKHNVIALFQGLVYRKEQTIVVER